MIDLHNHLLPGVDDGAKKVEETLEFLRLARRDGVKVVVATPHMKPGVYDNHRETILERVALVREAAKGDEAEGVTVLPGAEVYFTADLPARVRANALMTVGDGGRYLLLELPYQQIPMQVDDTIFQLRLLRVTPLMAPDGSKTSTFVGGDVAGISVSSKHKAQAWDFLKWTLDEQAQVEIIAKNGDLPGRTDLSGNPSFRTLVARRPRPPPRPRRRPMLRRGLIHVLASDGHDVRYRPPILSEGVRAAAAEVGETAARRMVEDTPQAILDGKDVEFEEPGPPMPGRGFAARLRSLFSRRS